VPLRFAPSGVRRTSRAAGWHWRFASGLRRFGVLLDSSFAVSVASSLAAITEDAVIDHQDTPLSHHIDAFIEHQKAKGVVPVRVSNTLAQLRRVAADLREWPGHKLATLQEAGQ